MITIIPFDKIHLNSTFKWMQDEQLKKNFLFRRNLTKEMHSNWFANYNTDTTQTIYAIMYNDIHVGNIGLKDINTLDSKAEVWIYIGNINYKQQGIANRALELLIGKNKDKLNKLYCHVAEFNTPSLKLFAKQDFHIEGIFNKDLYINNIYYSLIRLCRIL